MNDQVPGSDYESRIESLAADARAARFGDDYSALGEPSDSAQTANPCALVVSRDGLGPVVGLYIDARTANDPGRFSQRELDLLHQATNDWLAVYADCYGVTLDPDFTVREAAELLVDTHDIQQTAALLTQVPSSRS